MSFKESVKEFYTNDRVYRFDKSKKIVLGVVSDSYDCSDSDMSDNPLQKGQVKVWWNNSLQERVCKQNSIKLLSRVMSPGEVVRRYSSEQHSRRGYCKNVRLTLTVQIIGTDKVIENVSSNRLRDLCELEIDSAICLGTKYGRVEDIDQEITMMSDCGSVVQILSSINHDVEDYLLLKKNRTFTENFFYPGQEVICIPNHLEQPLWLRKSKSLKKHCTIRTRFTVQTVKLVRVDVTWYDESVAVLKPDEFKDLKVLPHFSDYVDIRKTLKINPSDVFIRRSSWLRKLGSLFRRDMAKPKTVNDNKSLGKLSKYSLSRLNSTDKTDSDDEWITEDDDVENPEEQKSTSKISVNDKYKRKYYPPRIEDLNPGNNVTVEVLAVDAKATIVWQDGTEELNVPMTQLCYSFSLDEHEFFPGEWVLRDKDELDEYGVVQNVNTTERTAKVKWLTYDENAKKHVEQRIEEVSVYDVVKHSKFMFKPGTTVRARPLRDFCVGRIVDCSVDGYLAVQWMNGTTETCCPQELEEVPEVCEFDLSADDDDEDSEIRDYSWTTESVESYEGDISDETTLQNLAARLDFIRNRIVYFKEAFKRHTFQDDLVFLKDFLLVYDNSSYLDKLLGTSFFSLKSNHFQVILAQTKEKARATGYELKGRIFLNDSLYPSTTRMKHAERENFNKVMKIESKVNAHIVSEEKSANREASELSPCDASDVNLCIELLSMLKIRMDLAYAELISRLGGDQALSIITKATNDLPAVLSSSNLMSTLSTGSEEKLPALNARAHDVAKQDKQQPVVVENATAEKEIQQEVENQSQAQESEKSQVEKEQLEKRLAYCALDEVPATHHFCSKKFKPVDVQKIMKAIQKEYMLFNESLPDGVMVRSFNNRIDLLSVLIVGPAKTPYEDGLFIFDLQLSHDYPRSAPFVHYVSYSSKRLNPNLYVEGKVCVSLLGTWMGKGTEMWSPKSTLLQLFVSIQGLILVAEPYYNEAGYEKQTATAQGVENSRTYNEMVTLKLLQSMTDMLLSPPEVFKQEVYAHFAERGNALCQRLQGYCDENNPIKPDFSLLPVSKGLKLSLTAALKTFQDTLKVVLSNNVNKTDATSDNLE